MTNLFLTDVWRHGFNCLSFELGKMQNDNSYNIGTYVDIFLYTHCINVCNCSACLCVCFLFVGSVL